MTMQQIVAANVRARLAWGQVGQDAAAEAAGCSIRSFRYKVSGEYGFRPDELAGLARLLELNDVGDFFRVPEGFAEPQRMVKMNWGGIGGEATRWLTAA